MTPARGDGRSRRPFGGAAEARACSAGPLPDWRPWIASTLCRPILFHARRKALSIRRGDSAGLVVWFRQGLVEVEIYIDLGKLLIWMHGVEHDFPGRDPRCDEWNRLGLGGQDGGPDVLADLQVIDEVRAGARDAQQRPLRFEPDVVGGRSPNRGVDDAVVDGQGTHGAGLKIGTSACSRSAGDLCGERLHERHGILAGRTRDELGPRLSSHA